MAPNPSDDLRDNLDDSLDDGLDELLGDPDRDPVLGPFVAGVRRLATEPAPAPSAALAAVLAGSDRLVDDPADEPAARRRKRMAPIRTVAGLSLAAKISLGAVAAAAATTGAAAAGVLPEPVQESVAEVVSVATPFELPGSPAAPASFGQSVRGDATDAVPGVDGRAVADAARQAAGDRRPDDVPGNARSGRSGGVDDDHDEHDDDEHDDGGDDHDDDHEGNGPRSHDDDEATDDSGHSSTAPRGVPASTPVANGGGAGPDRARGNVPPAGSGGAGR